MECMPVGVESLELELQVVMSPHVCAEPRSSGKTARALTS